MKTKIYLLLTSVTLVILLLVSAVIPVYAETSEASSALSQTSSEVSDDPTNPGITSGNALVAYSVDADMAIYEQRGNETLAPTVATKLVVAMVAYDLIAKASLPLENTTVTVDAASLTDLGAVGAANPQMGISAGESYTLFDLLSATIVSNASDACSVLADYCQTTFLNGENGAFLEQMNQKAKDLGLTKTVFRNVTGKDTLGMTTTPLEVAKIASAFYLYNDLVRISDVAEYRFGLTSRPKNKNYLKSNYYVNGYLMSEAIGMIAGQQSGNGGYCLITACKKDGYAYVFVVMDATCATYDTEGIHFSEGNAYDDMKKLVPWVTKSFGFKALFEDSEYLLDELSVRDGKDADYVGVVPESRPEVMLPAHIQFKDIVRTIQYDDSVVKIDEKTGEKYVNAPVSVGQKLGVMLFTCNGETVAEVPLVAKSTVDVSTLGKTINSVGGFLESPTMKTIVIVILSLVGAYVIFAVTSLIIRIVKRAKKRKKKVSVKKQEKRDPREITKNVN